MLVTKTETYTDWSFQATHMGELATPNRQGLLDGYIYYRYAHDFLKEGERLVSETSSVVLTDGSVYPLGQGEAQIKGVRITYLGQDASGDVSIHVQGDRTIGIGVSTITRTAIIEYDDGKVPVLDREQLDEILDEVKGTLQSGVETAVATAKSELQSEINNTRVEIEEDIRENVDYLTQSFESTVQEARTELTGSIDSVRTDLNAKVDTAKSQLSSRIEINYNNLNTVIADLGIVRTTLNDRIDSVGTDLTALGTRVDNVSNDLTSARTELSRRVNELLDRAPKICGWGHSEFFDTSGDSWVNLTVATSGDITGNTTFVSRSGNYIKVNDGAKPFDRVFRIVVTGRIGFMTGGAVSDRVRIAALKKDGTVIAETSHFFGIENANNLSYMNMQFELSMRIHANDANNPLLTDGINLVLGRVGRQTIRLNSPGVTCELVGTV